MNRKMPSDSMIAPVQFRYRAEAEAEANGWEMSAEPWSVLWRPESVEGPRGLLTFMRNSPGLFGMLQGAFTWARYVGRAVQHDGHRPPRRRMRPAGPANLPSMLRLDRGTRLVIQVR